MVREADAAALVTDAHASLAARGHAPVITAASEVRLVRLAALMLDGFGIGTERKEENDG